MPPKGKQKAEAKAEAKEKNVAKEAERAEEAKEHASSDNSKKIDDYQIIVPSAIGTIDLRKWGFTPP